MWRYRALFNFLMREPCLDNLIKADALINFALHSDINDTPADVIFDYLWGLSDFIKQAKKSYEVLEGFFR